MRDAQHLVRIRVVLDWPELEPCADIHLTATGFFHAQEPDIGIEAAVADELEKVI